jgi:hypothetical protein
MKVVGYDPFVPKDLAEAWEDRILPSPEAVA